MAQAESLEDLDLLFHPVDPVCTQCRLLCSAELVVSTTVIMVEGSSFLDSLGPYCSAYSQSAAGAGLVRCYASAALDGSHPISHWQGLSTMLKPKGMTEPIPQILPLTICRL